MAPPRYNLNAARNGTRLTRLTVGELPRQLNHVKIEGRRYRRALEAVCGDVHGEVSVTDAHSIDTATGATVHAGICRWLLREKIGVMASADILACSRELLKAKETRDRAVRLLRLDTRRDVLDVLYGDPAPTESPESPASSPTVRSCASGGEERENIPRERLRPNSANVCDNQEEEKDDENV